MKPNYKTFVFFVSFFVLCFSEVAQAQKKKVEAPIPSLSEIEDPVQAMPTSKKSVASFAMQGYPEKIAPPSYEQKSSTQMAKIKDVENMTLPDYHQKNLARAAKILDVEDNTKQEVTYPKVLFPTAAMVKQANKQVAGLVAVLKAESNTSFSMAENDNVLLHYNSTTGKIELSPLNSNSEVLQEVTATSLNGVLVIKGNNNDNNLVVDDSVLELGIHILYEGGGEQTTKGDILTLKNTGMPWENVVTSAYNKSSGKIIVNNKSFITYTGLEPIIYLGTGGTLTINLPNVPNPDVVVASEVTPNLTIVSGSTFENHLFNGFDAIVINGGTDMDNVSFQGVDPTMDSDMTLNFDTDDLVTFETTPTDLVNKDITVNTGFLVVSEDITTMGNIDLTSERSTVINNNATISVTDGAISIAGGTAIVMNDVYNGVLLDDGNVQATGVGTITIIGTGSNDGANSRTQGVFVTGTSLLETVSGDISITGTGASSGIERQNGIRINEGDADGATLQSADGDILLLGFGGNGTSIHSDGVYLHGVNPILLTGTGSLVVTGFGGTGASSLYGVFIASGLISLEDGSVELNGTGGVGNGNFCEGVGLVNGVTVQISGTGTVLVSGQGGSSSGGQQNDGIVIQASNIKASGGGIVLNGNGGSAGFAINAGISFLRGANIEDSENGDIILNGTGGASNQQNHGVSFDLAPNSSVTTNNGNIIITGTSGIPGFVNRGIDMRTGNLLATGTGSIQLNGTSNSSGTLSEGVYVENSNVSTTTGDITMIGAGNGNGLASDGINVLENSLVSTTSGNITMTGTSTAVGQQHRGVYIYTPAKLQTEDGTITINGTGGSGAFGEHHGVVLGGGNVVRATGSGSVNVTGAGGSGGAINAGMLLYNNGLVSTSGGGITFNGQGGTGTGNSHLGIYIIAGGSISDTAGGSIVLNGTGGTGAVTNVGVYINGNLGSSITTTNADISITGTGGTGGDSNNGVHIESETQVSATGTGAVQITGIAGTGANNNVGILLVNPAVVQTEDGNITMNGTGGNGSGNFQVGTALLNGNIVQIAGEGIANINGTGGTGIDNNYGVLVQNAAVTTSGGGAVITGDAGPGSGDGQIGVILLLASTISDAANGDLVLNGTAGNGVDLNSGIFLDGGSRVSSLDGNISMKGVGDGTGDFNHGLQMSAAAVIENTGMGSINLQGTGGDGVYINQGIRMENTGTKISTIDGGITLSGTGGNATGTNNEGITIINEASIEAEGTGSITLTGNAVAGDGSNKGVVLFAPNTFVRSNGGGIAITGNGAGTGSNNLGISLENASSIQDMVDGNIVLNGTGGNGLSTNRGISITAGSVVTTMDGEISLTGQGGIGTGNSNDGILINGVGSQVTSSQGNIQIMANGGSSGSGSQHIGLYVNGSGTIQTVDGDINIQGVGGDGLGNYHNGVHLASQGRIEATGTGSVDITGIGGAGTSSNTGVWLQNSNTRITANGGGIAINGTGGPSTGDFSIGVLSGFEADIIENGMGTITIDGAADTANLCSCGVLFQNTGSTIVSNGGGITITGTGGNALSQDATGLYTYEGLLQDTGNGTITMNGIGGTAPSFGAGTWIDASSVITTATGAIQIAGTSTNTPGTGKEGILIDGNSVITSTSGNIDLLGTCVAEETSAINIAAIGGPIATGGTITATGIIGEINTPAGIPATAIFEGANTIINGVFSPGQSPGQVTVNGDFTIGSGDRLLVEFLDYLNPGTDFDQVVVNGLVTITDAALELDNITGAAEDSCETVTLIDNDGTDAVIGTFAGIAEGDSVNLGDITGKISYVGGDGNDVVLVLDDTLPTVTCPADITINTDAGNCSAMASFPMPITQDNCGVATVVQTMGDPSGSAFPVGVNTIEFTATDVNGNTNTCSFNITVVDNEAPTMICQNITIQLDASGNASITAADVDGGSTDNCGIAGTSVSPNTFDCGDVGDNPVVLTVTDVHGNSNTCTAIVTVQDVTNPVVACQNITVELDPLTGTVTILGTDIDNGSTDACGIASYDLDIDTFDCSNIGNNTVVLTVTDVNGNSDTCTAIVTVEDNTSPVLVCQDFTLELGPDGTAMLDPNDVIASNTDNCGIATVAVDVNEFSCADIGTPVTVQVFTSDVNGNLSTCTAVVTVVDLLEPVLTCPADQTVDPGAGNLFYIVPDYFATGEATAIDNCTDPVAITTQDPAAGTPLTDGTYTIALTATDEYGNTATCEFELTVESILGVGDNNANIGSLQMYPNPAKHSVTIGNPQSLSLESLSIFDLRGRMVKSIDLRNMGTQKTIDVSEMAAATYLVIIQGENGQITKRLIKE
ncbi:hypothetical protein A7A78_07935 [Aequorivita soesokkakensis]|uniref:HYR domain-containing protein n=1 Tax=Aequorivita soesokkakensis TaxID=1385699 RepID=A0A1A9LA28_9FLAO|nr:HYR domain-containing protein [Aequorivita soesokkakensis]OAD90138.1 hypothetical protein A7A78_07935 [Aequorivita soesokkakensis]